jgi:hypothetical protein
MCLPWIRMVQRLLSTLRVTVSYELLRGSASSFDLEWYGWLAALNPEAVQKNRQASPARRKC